MNERGGSAARAELWVRAYAPSRVAGEGRAVLERVASFRKWAREHGRSLSPSFRVEGTGAEPTIDAERDVTAGDGVVVLPAVALAEFEDGGLTHVTPHAEGERVRTVADRSAALSGTEPSRGTAVESE